MRLIRKVRFIYILIYYYVFFMPYHKRGFANNVIWKYYGHKTMKWIWKLGQAFSLHAMLFLVCQIYSIINPESVSKSMLCILVTCHVPGCAMWFSFMKRHNVCLVKKNTNLTLKLSTNGYDACPTSP